MGRIIISETEKNQILKNHGLILEIAAEDQPLMDYKNFFMSKDPATIANALQEVLDADSQGKIDPPLSDDERKQLNMGVDKLKNKVTANLAKNYIDNELTDQINSNPEKAKKMLCYYTQTLHTSEPESKKLTTYCGGNKVVPSNTTQTTINKPIKTYSNSSSGGLQLPNGPEVKPTMKGSDLVKTDVQNNRELTKEECKDFFEIKNLEDEYATSRTLDDNEIKTVQACLKNYNFMFSGARALKKKYGITGSGELR